jgi:hypothetical protein
MDPATMAACMASMRWDLVDIPMVELPESVFASSNAYAPVGLSNSFQSLDDPAALLESLAAFDHVPSGNETNATGSNDHFASLLQAAATATGAEAAQDEQDQERRGANQSPAPEIYVPSQNLPNSEVRRKRTQAELDEETFGWVANKAPRHSSTEDEADQLAREREIWGPEDNEEATTTTFESQHTPLAGADARSAGVHSAAALFRRPSTVSKKYTSRFTF